MLKLNNTPYGHDSAYWSGKLAWRRTRRNRVATATKVDPIICLFAAQIIRTYLSANISTLKYCWRNTIHRVSSFCTVYSNEERECLLRTHRIVLAQRNSLRHVLPLGRSLLNFVLLTRWRIFSAWTKRKKKSRLIN